MNPEKIRVLRKIVLIYNNKYNKEKFLNYKVKKIKSYKALYFKHKSGSIYSKKMVAFFAQVTASNFAGLGDFKGLIYWTFNSVKTDPFTFKNYYKPIFIFLKRRFIPYRSS